ncbi:hypothetical protein K402DRAFT_408868 [Aulographum hederae CBS 113979]|uniref:Uncharacterized protein n=1 Tax=Aulographum hederae CBS 113979 TaxID=1176131 RepID=A0A6G1GIU6_9PEZI|nr:hypothetical protein K402DRAFT_408868 [Aulographum hederae CBS 113979]
MPPERCTTSKRAKADFRKNGPTISSYNQRLLERGAELDARARLIKEKERKRKIAVDKKKAKDRKDREARLRNGGVGYATQMAGFCHSQHKMKNGMRAFLETGKIPQAEKNVEIGAGEHNEDEPMSDNDGEPDSENGASSPLDTRGPGDMDHMELNDEKSQTKRSVKFNFEASVPSNRNCPDVINNQEEQETLKDPWDEDIFDDEELLSILEGEKQVEPKLPPICPNLVQVAENTSPRAQFAPSPHTPRFNAKRTQFEFANINMHLNFEEERA